MSRLLIAALVAAACGPSPAPVLAGKSEAAPATAPAAPPVTAPAAPPAEAAAPASDPPVKREPPLTPEEIALIETDPATLTPEMRVQRAHALRRKILQNPDSPQAKQLEELRRLTETGVVVPTLPGASPAQSGDGLVLSAPTRRQKAEKSE